MQYCLSQLRTWFYQVWQSIEAIKPGTDEEIFWGFLRILGFLSLAIVVFLMFSHRKPQDMM